MFPVTIGPSVSHLLLIVKIMEYIIHLELNSTLESHNLISDCQLGFRKYHSATHLLLETVHDWAKALVVATVCA